MDEQSPANPDRYEPFNGAGEMVSIREAALPLSGEGRSQVVLTARIATDSVWSMTIDADRVASRVVRSLYGK